MATPLIGLLALPGALLLSGAAAAQALLDPTLPPAPLRSAATQTAAPPALKLQMILRGSDDAHRALIDGRWLRAGESLPGTSARVLRITDTAVLLVHDKEAETLDLLPTITKQVAQGDAGREASK